MICALSYPEGKFLGKEVDLDHLLSSSLLEEWQRIRVFPAGTHNLTPARVPEGNWDYTLEVRANGSGTLEMSGRSRDVVTYEIENKKTSGPRPADRTVRLPNDETFVIIAVQKSPEGPHLYHIIFYVSSQTDAAEEEGTPSSIIGREFASA